MTEVENVLWRPIEPLFSRILAHPFLTGLADGTLPEASFRHYVEQDTLYLRSFARGLALLGSRAESDDALTLFCTHAANAIAVERELHKGFIEEWESDYDAVTEMDPAPNTLLYTSYLLRVAYERPHYEGLGAFLPCYWIYREVGKALEGEGSPHALYQRWIATYGGEEFGEVVDAVLGIMEETLKRLTAEQKSAVQRHFVQTSKLEYLFWDMGYERQTWPV